jgi:hypothetical protein
MGEEIPTSVSCSQKQHESRQQVGGVYIREAQLLHHQSIEGDFTMGSARIAQLSV